MDRLQLAMLVNWAGENGIQGRKRLQKVVYFLKSVGCPISAEYSLHHYGPYSRDVADVCDEMVSANLLVELPGTQYTYKLAPETPAILERSRTAASDRFAAMELFEAKARHLLAEDLWTLELGSTILYFKKLNLDWASALARACEYKKADATKLPSQKALAIARDYLPESVPA